MARRSFVGGSPMGMKKSPARVKRERNARKAQEKRWAAKSSEVVVSHLCEVENCNGDCGEWHRF
jgi:hypothetical protein